MNLSKQLKLVKETTDTKSTRDLYTKKVVHKDTYANKQVQLNTSIHKISFCYKVYTVW